MQRSLGIMQGRLLPKYKGRYQAHPVGYWMDEFQIAKQLGLDGIEFILDFEGWRENPLMTNQGRNEIIALSAVNNISVKSICADVFMELPLHSEDKSRASNAKMIMNELISAAAILGVADIVIPCVDQSSLRNGDAVLRLRECLFEYEPMCEEKNVNLALETDLNPEAFNRLLDGLPNFVTVNYDVGNSAALGFNIKEEFNAYGTRITDIHIKDRQLGGGSVFLGSGDANFELFFECINSLKYFGTMIMQVYRDDEGINVFKEQMKIFRTMERKYA